MIGEWKKVSRRILSRTDSSCSPACRPTKAIHCSWMSGPEFVHQNGSLMRNRYRAELLDSTTYSRETALSPRCRLPPVSWLSAYLKALCTLSNVYTVYSLHVYVSSLETMALHNFGQGNPFHVRVWSSLQFEYLALDRSVKFKNCW